MKKISRRSFVKAAGTALALTALTACGGSSSSTAASTTASSAASGSAAASSEAVSADVQAIIDRGVLKVGVKNAVKGFSFQDTLTGEYTGLEDSLAEMIAEHLGVDVEFTTVTAATRGELLDSGDIDCVLATFTITDERKKSWDFSTPYRTDHVGILIKKNSGMSKMADLDGKIIGVSQGSTTKDLVLKMLEDEKIDATPEFKEFPDYPSIKSALDAGNVDAFAMDRSTLKTYTTDDCQLLQPEIEFGAQDYGVATKKGCDLSKTVDDTVKKLQKDGWIDEEISKWGLL